LGLGLPLQFSLTLQGLDSAKLATNASLQQSFLSAMEELVSESTGVAAESVTIELKASPARRLRRLQSEPVKVSISLDTGDVAPANLASQLDPKLLSTMTPKMKAMPSIEQVISGDLTISEITAPTVPAVVVESLHATFGEEEEMASSSLPSCLCFHGAAAALLVSALATLS